MSQARSPAPEKYVYCPCCDYNLHGLPDGECPECGTPFDIEQLKISRVAYKGSLKDVVGTLIGWPVMVWFALIPAAGMVLLPLVMLFVVIMDSDLLTMVCAFGLAAVLIGVVLYYTVRLCQDLARQTHRILRSQSHKDPPSRESLFWLLLLSQLSVIMFFPVPFVALYVVTST